ncbi:MAG: PAS domain S-box protein [Isosphaeraceae bacterium]
MIGSQATSYLPDDTAERRFRLLADSMPEIVWTASPCGHRDYVNRRWLEYSGLEVHASLGRDWLAAVHPSDLADFLRQWDRSVASSLRFEVEYRLRRSDGAYRWFLSCAEPVLDAGGRVVRWVGTCTDVDDRRAAIEERLRESTERLVASEARFRATFENAAVGISHVSPDGRWLRVNGTLCAITGYPRDELLALTFADITHPDDVEADWANVRRLLAGEGSTYTMEKRYVRKDGQVVWGNLTVSLIRSADGTPEFFISVVEDISTRKRAEEQVGRLNAELSARLHELQTVLDTAPVGINVARDPACKVIVGNPAISQMLGTEPGGNVSVSRDDAEPLPFRVLKDGQEVPAETLPMQRAAALGRPVGDRLYEVVRADGTTIQMLARANPIRDGSGAVTGAVGVCLDVTALKRAERALREADRRKNEFLAMLAHELRNPLNAISAAHELAQLEGIPPEEVRWANEVIGRQVRQLGRLIEDLLDVSRISRGKIGLKKERVDLAAVVARAVASARAFIEARRHELTVEISPQPMPLDADPARLEQVLTNLLNNAAKYTDPGGRIFLTVGPEEDELVVRVRDNGIGIPRELLPRVFDLFIQADDSVSRSQGGLGIGLTLVRSLTEMHGGRISVASEGPGRGAEFTVRLPRNPDDPTGPTVTGSKASTQAARVVRRVLVVDDNADTLRGTTRLLGRRGHIVFTAQDGPTALAAAREHRPDRILLDIGLPGMSGYEVAAELRREFGDQPRLIAVSGYAQESDRRRARESGFNHHLAKPVNLEALVAIVEAGD